MNRDEEEREVGEEEGKWGWERWKRHFALIEESERLVDELQVNFIPIYLLHGSNALNVDGTCL